MYNHIQLCRMHTHTHTHTHTHVHTHTHAHTHTHVHTQTHMCTHTPPIQVQNPSCLLHGENLPQCLLHHCQWTLVLTHVALLHLQHEGRQLFGSLQVNLKVRVDNLLVHLHRGKETNKYRAYDPSPGIQTSKLLLSHTTQHRETDSVTTAHR